MSGHRAKVMGAQYMKAIKEPNELVMFSLKSDNEPFVWYILLRGFSGDNDEFDGGEYLVRQVAPEDFPFKPPEFYFMTENGVYGCETKVCINIGEYHADQYRAALGMDGFANQLVSGMIGWKTLGGGISILSTTANEKRRLAKISRDYNRKHYPEIIAQIESAFDDYSKKWTNVPEPLRIKFGLPESKTDVAAVPQMPMPGVTPTSAPAKSARAPTGKRTGASAASNAPTNAPASSPTNAPTNAIAPSADAPVKP